MKWKSWKLVGFMVFVGVMACVVLYADRHKQKRIRLPDAVKAAIEASYPGAEIEEIEVEHEGVKVYEVELEQNGQEIEVEFASDGSIVEVETELAMEDLPPAVAKAIRERAKGAKIKEIEKEVVYAVVRLVELDEPQVSYEAEFIKNDKEIEIEVAADGTVLKLKVEDDDDDNDND